jgi:hypothetical protein
MSSRRRGFGATLDRGNGEVGTVNNKMSNAISEALMGRGGSRELLHEAQFHAGGQAADSERGS